jgi:glycosyltransferase involved in cell wall biosynthesis
VRISIITLAVDTPPFIDEAIASVRHPPGVDVEHIIIHDGSDDDFALLAQRFPSLRILRGSGRGATAAANEALKQTSGDFVFFLNSDDRLAENAIAAFAGAALGSPQVEVWTGQTRLFSNAADDRETTLRHVADRASTALTLTNVLDDIPLLTARFVRRDVYDRFCGLNERFHACSDREFMIRLALAGAAEAPLNVPVSELRLHEDSSTIRLPQTRIPQYLACHVELARRWMAEPSISSQQRAIFRNWHARELLRLAYYNMKAGQLREAIRIVLAGLRMDPAWPWRARTMRVARHLRRRNDWQS